MAKTKNFKPKINDQKFSELVLYISESCKDDPTFGAVKLNKILYYSDFYAFRILGEPITGATYQKLQEGPAPREMLSQRRHIMNRKRATLEARPYFNGVQHRLVPAPTYRPEMVNEFISPKEKMIVDEVISFFEGKTAREVSDYSHNERGWLLVEFGEDIPYETAFLSSQPLEEDEREFGADLARDSRVG